MFTYSKNNYNFYNLIEKEMCLSHLYHFLLPLPSRLEDGVSLRRTVWPKSGAAFPILKGRGKEEGG